MLFMVIEQFTEANLALVHERFQKQGRMLPDGVIYHASWIEPSGARCFQIMEACDQDALSTWTSRWSDIVRFEIHPVLASGDFWAARAASRG